MHKMVNGVKVDLTQEEIDQLLAEQKQWEAERAAIAWRTNRIANYPQITEQLDMLWHAMNLGKLPKDNEFYESIKAVKDAYPKPISPEGTK